VRYVTSSERFRRRSRAHRSVPYSAASSAEKARKHDTNDVWGVAFAR
jgi:hypothetical protein